MINVTSLFDYNFVAREYIWRSHMLKEKLKQSSRR